jgi:hypothetical protein
MNGDDHPDDDRVVETLISEERGVSVWCLARWRAHQARWIHKWTGRPIDTVVSWRERIECACQRA